ncbi:MAG: metal ABC transporter permease [Actinobacteria bacterium]|nr:metal ABC transporter permease [Actinomycetota bacterium]
MLSHSFIRLALLAGTPIAIASGLVGYALVLRSQVFAGDALSHVAFTGALAAAAAGVDVRVGLFAGAVVVSAGMGALGPRARADDVVIGAVFAWILGLGALFLSLFTMTRSGGNGVGGVRVLFGSIFGLSPGEATLAAIVAAAVVVVLLLIARPLLFASLDGGVAEALGLPVRALGLLFLCLVGLTAAEATQAVGALLLLGLLAAPAGAANRLTASPYRGLALSAGLAAASLWLGIVLAYAIPSLPPSSAIIGVATLIYAVAAATTRRRPAAVRWSPSRSAAGNRDR